MEAAAESRCPNCFSAPLSTPCRRCGWASGLDNPPPALALGTVLDGRYRIGRVLGHGGFGITYLAWDENLHLRLAIKEYLPRDSATRAPDGVSLAVYSGPAAEQFAYGLERFLEEARALARFDQHPGIVTVKSFFRAHGTGYSVMEFVDGLTLKQYLGQQPEGRLAFEPALKLLMPVMDALRAVHKDGLLHRDITPDNIYLSQDGRVKLLDFGAARFAAGEHSRSLSVILKPGYAPEEQYRTRGQQGPWTDVYSLAATLYRAITGQVPPEALDRLDADELVPPSQLGAVIAPEQEAVLVRALAVRASARFESVEALQRAWKGAAEESAARLSEPLSIANLPAGSSQPHAIKSGSVQPKPNWPLPLTLLPSDPAANLETEPNCRYTDNGDGTVTDIKTGLMWKRCSEGQTWDGTTCLGQAGTMNWSQAMPNEWQKQWPPFAGYADWRMPTINELLTLVYCSSGRPKTWNDTGGWCDGNYEKPTIDQTAFPNTPSSAVWSGSPDANDSYYAWVVHFGVGLAYSDYRDYYNHVRLVRSGQ
jgi:serine/threonine protein kinase